VLADPTLTWSYKFSALITQAELRQAGDELEYLLRQLETSTAFVWRPGMLCLALHMRTLMRNLTSKKRRAVYNPTYFDDQTDYMNAMRVDVLNTFTGLIRNAIEVLRDV
jgi:hypothetical protein